MLKGTYFPTLTSRAEDLTTQMQLLQTQMREFSSLVRSLAGFGGNEGSQSPITIKEHSESTESLVRTWSSEKRERRGSLTNGVESTLVRHHPFRCNWIAQLTKSSCCAISGGAIAG